MRACPSWTEGGALWKRGNPHLADLWNAVAEVDVDEGMDIKLMREGPEGRGT
jgi:hypothetical protein